MCPARRNGCLGRCASTGSQVVLISQLALSTIDLFRGAETEAFGAAAG